MAQIKIITKTDVIDNVNATSENPVQSKVISSALSGKLDKKGYASSLEGKYAKVVNKGTTAAPSYEVDFENVPAQTNANWMQETITEPDYIKNKPFSEVGAGLTVKEISGVKTLTANTQFKFQIFDELPTAAAEYAQVIGLKLKATTETGNVYDEYACVDVGTSESPSWKWELIGAIKATVTQTTTEIKVDGTALQTASATQIGLLSSTDFDTFNKKQSQIPAGTSGQVVTYSGTAGTVGALAVDTTATTGSTNLITSGAVYNATNDKVPYASGSSNKAFTLGMDSEGGLYYETA